jgi:anti-repressor protein
MKQLITITKQTIGNEEINAVDARELWVFLENGYEFSKWIKDRIKSYDFVQGVDFITKINSYFSPPRKDYTISIDMAKELAMVEKNQKGKEARKYFIQCEKELKQIQPKLPSYSESLRQLADSLDRNKTLQLENKTQRRIVHTQKRKLKRQKPKVDYYNNVLDSTADFTTTQIAKEVEMTATHLNIVLEQAGVQYKQSGQWMLKKEYQDKGLTRTRTYLIEGTTGPKTSHSTVWTEKGRKFIIELLEDI